MCAVRTGENERGSQEGKKYLQNGTSRMHCNKNIVNDSDLT
jgi:hypothetical protein